MNTQLFIPKKIKVGFQMRPDTYTGKLGYVIAHDGKVWRKEKSWEGWVTKFKDSPEMEAAERKVYENQLQSLKTSYNQYKTYYTQDPSRNTYYKKYAEMTEEQFLQFYKMDTFENARKNGGCRIGNVSSDEGIKPKELDNVPTEGFVLNKKAGGYSSGWNHRQTYCRVYDPRGFEFEITVPNLLYILENTTSYKGKGLEGEFVYSWDGKDLVLLPTSCPEYVKSEVFTKLQSQKIGVKDLKAGYIYETKRQEKLIYLGRFDYAEKTYKKGKYQWNNNKKHIFIQNKNQLVALSGLASLAGVITDSCVENYADLMDIYTKSKHSSKLKEIFEKKIELTLDPQYQTKSYANNPHYNNYLKQNYFYIKHIDGNYIHVSCYPKVEYGYGILTQRNGGYIFQGYELTLQSLIQTSLNKNKELSITSTNAYSDKYALEIMQYYKNKKYSLEEVKALNPCELYLRTENGGEIKAQDY